MQKTDKFLSVPLIKESKSLLDEESISNKNDFKVFTNQVTNRHLKDIMRLAEIKKK
jgi:hypothetical protein